MEPISPASSQESPSPSPEKKSSARHGRTFLLVLIALVGGFVGGIVSPVVREKLVPYLPKTFQSSSLVTTPRTMTVISEEDAVANLVEKNSPGVVSIVISKDVPKVRNFFGNSFGFPFFDPFNSGTQSTETEKQKVGSGSGFFVSSDGLIVTNKHVVADEQADYTVLLGDGEEHPAKVLARDPSNDIAVIKIDGSNFPALTLGDSEKIRVGETVIAIGNPLGEFENSVSRGIVSGLRRNLDAGSDWSGDAEHLSDIIQIDAAINPGNSGGPLFDLAGEVIGVNVAMAQGAENIGFSLPINQVKRIVDQVRTTGKLSFPYLGVRSLVLNDQLQKKTGLPYNHGALVVRGESVTDFAVVPGSPADKAGIVENDIILEINGQKVDSDHSLVYVIGQHSVGDQVTLKLWHKGDTKEVKVTLEERQ